MRKIKKIKRDVLKLISENFYSNVSRQFIGTIYIECILTSLWNSVRSIVRSKRERKRSCKRSLTAYPRKVTNKSQDSRPFPTCFHPLSVSLYPRSPQLPHPRLETVFRRSIQCMGLALMTLKRRGRACDFFVGISGRNLICLIGVGPAEWGIAGAKFEQSCILERRKFIGVTPVSSASRSLIFAVNIARYLVYKRESVANSQHFSYTHFLHSIFSLFFLF